MPVISALGGLRQEDQFQDKPGLHSETLFKKKKKIFQRLESLVV
jgi:hypothetical protein